MEFGFNQTPGAVDLYNRDVIQTVVKERPPGLWLTKPKQTTSTSGTSHT